MSKWKSATLGDISSVITGPFGSQLHQSDYTDKGIASIMPQNIGERTVNLNEISHISKSDATRLKRFIVYKDDIVYSRRGDVEKHAFITAELSGALCGTGCLRVRFNSNCIYPEFISLYLDRPESKTWIRQHAVGSSMPNLNSGILADVPVKYPDYEEQVLIAKCLCSIEQKIALNKRINAELEAMAKTIYDYWFVQFDFPNENGKPYRTSGGAMEYNDQLKREIPKGWKVERIIDVFDVCYGFPFDTEQFTDSVDGYPVVRIRDILDCTISAYTGEKVDEKYWLKNNDLIIGMDGNFHMNFWNNQPALLNQRCFRIRAINGYSVMQALFSAKPYIKSRELNVNRTTVGHLSADDVKALYILTPPEPYQSTVTKILDSALCNISNNARENIDLTRLRDWLLPMLMNGQATVADKQPTEAPQNVVEMPGNDKRFDLWLQNQGIAARGDLDKKTLREIFDAMDDDDK